MNNSEIRQVIRVYILGDSIAYGQYIPVHDIWVTEISSELNNIYKSQGIQILVQNPSVCGNTTRQALDRIAYDVIQHKPDILVIQFGLNDCNYWQTDNGIQRVPPQVFSANIEEIVIRAKAVGTKRILVNTNHPTTRTTQILQGTNIAYETSNMQYNQIIRNTVQKIDDPSVQLNDIDIKIRGILDSRGMGVGDIVLPEPDQLHLSQTGHMLYSQIMKDELIKSIDAII